MQQRFLLLLTLLMSLVGSTTANAQDNTDIWYLRDSFLQGPTLFTLSGEERVLGNIGWDVSGLIRITDEIFIGTVDPNSADETDGDLYRFTPDAATPFNLTEIIQEREIGVDTTEPVTEITRGFLVLAHQYPYVLLTESQEYWAERLYVLVNVETMEAQLLDYRPDLRFIELCCRFTTNENGDVLLRYVANDLLSDDPSEMQRRLVEQNLTTATTTVIRDETDGSLGAVWPDPTGERWVFRDSQDGMQATSLVQISGESRMLAEPVSTFEADTYVYQGDLLIGYPADCDEGCNIGVTFPDGQHVVYAIVPPLDRFYVRRVWVVDAEERRLLLLTDDEIFMLERFAVGSAVLSQIENMRNEYVSYDGRGVIIKMEDSLYGLFDTHTLNLVASTEAPVVTGYSLANAYILSTSDQTLVYWYDDETTSSLVERDIVVHAVLDDGRILYTQEGLRESNILLFDPSTAEATILFERDAMFPVITDLRYQERYYSLQ